MCIFLIDRGGEPINAPLTSSNSPKPKTNTMLHKLVTCWHKNYPVDTTGKYPLSTLRVQLKSKFGEPSLRKNSTTTNRNRIEFSNKIKQGPSLAQFIAEQQHEQSNQEIDLMPTSPILSYPSGNINNIGEGRNVYIETYGCQMNVSDTEIILSIMKNAGFEETKEESKVI
jgi:hypothetical protein